MAGAVEHYSVVDKYDAAQPPWLLAFDPRTWNSPQAVKPAAGDAVHVRQCSAAEGNAFSLLHRSSDSGRIVVATPDLSRPCRTCDPPPRRVVSFLVPRRRHPPRPADSRLRSKNITG